VSQPALTGFFLQCLSYLLTSNLHIHNTTCNLELLYSYLLNI
jgi:hypothetical protein